MMFFLRVLCGCTFLVAGGVAFAQPIALKQVGTFRVAADTVELSGSHAFVAGGRTLTILDLSDPSSPKKVSDYSFPEQIWSFRLAGPYAYVAANFYGLGVLDVSNPAAPKLRASIKTPGQAKGVALVGTTAFVADHMSGVDVVDLSSLDKPTLRGSFFVDGYARDVAASSRFAFAVDAPTGLYALDPARPGPPDAIGQIQSAAAPSMIEVMEQGGRVIACLVGGGALQLYDVTDPAKPVHLTSWKTPGGRPGRIALDGARGYLTDGREGVQIVDLSNPSSPALVGNIKTAAPARDVAVGGGLVVVAVGMGEGNEEVVVLR
jgi:uncharacterized secreted protein with C-terminal beta-propeller domain